MKPSPDRIRALCPGVDERLLQEHLYRLGERYFETFSEEQLCAHLRGLALLSAAEPVRLLVERAGASAPADAQAQPPAAAPPSGTSAASAPAPPERVECTVLAFDYPAEFSLITGTLSAMGFNILQGDVFTYARSQAAEGSAGRGAMSRPAGRSAGGWRAGTAVPADPWRRRRIVDRFNGTLSSSLSLEKWSEELARRLSASLRLLESGTEEGALLARQKVNEQVAAHLVEVDLPPASAFYPVHIEVEENEGETTRIRVVSDDTPFFLYALSAALALRGITIERVSIRTTEKRIEDQFDILDAQGRRIRSAELLDQVKLSVLFTKQFTYFLGRAPDPYAALLRFEQLANDVLRLPEQGRWFELLSNPRVLQDLARLLGASDFLWEDFIRLQYETLLPMLEPHVEGRSFSEPPERLGERLARHLAGAASAGAAPSEKDAWEEKVDRLNEFKDREIFLMDLDHILTAGMDFRRLARGLTILAEEVVGAAASLARERLLGRYGAPRTIAGLEARLAVMGLGKLGGGDLGYASDIELLFVYSDNGRTTGPEAIDNAEFFNHLAQETALLVRARREGIFQVDLRLRPHGASGPLACSLESFCRYYGPGGGASSLERLALVRLRAVAGDRALGARVERLRDEMIYAGRSIRLEELRAMRERQLQDKAAGGRLNAKFSPGALVDLEYTVQILQVMYGGQYPALRTPRIWEALDELAGAAVLSREERGRIGRAYRFFRRLINSLRMLRGSAKDLFLPPEDSPEYAHLARRMGYARGGALAAEQQLHLDFDTETAAIRAFVKQHLGRESLPGPEAGNMADLVLSEDTPPELARRILAGCGLREADRALVNLRKLAGTGPQRDQFARLAVLAGDLLAHQPDPDMALNNWERFVRSLPDPHEHHRRMLSQPRGLEILLAIFAATQFLADTLIRNPEFLEWVTHPERLHRVRARAEMEADLEAASAAAAGHRQWLDELRRIRRREILRIGTRDICLDTPTGEIIQELSNLAEVFIAAALRRLWREQGLEGRPEDFFVLAYGKLGGRELNYSSDLDLLGVVRDQGDARMEPFRKAMEMLRADLSDHTPEGYAYRVDLRLRPFGRSGELVVSMSALRRYLERQASLWEQQALLKARPVAGNLALGEAFLGEARSVLTRAADGREIFRSIERMRAQSIRQLSRSPGAGVNLKLGPGGIRDVEFLVQGLQLANARQAPRELLEGNTLAALQALQEGGVLAPEAAHSLREDYLFLRKVEHSLQLFEDRQVHTLPKDPVALEALARRILGVRAGARPGAAGTGAGSVEAAVPVPAGTGGLPAAPEFLARLEDCLQRVQAAYRRVVQIDNPEPAR